MFTILWFVPKLSSKSCNTLIGCTNWNTLKGFKIELKKTTILVGANNFGKSSIIQFLQFLNENFPGERTSVMVASMGAEKNHIVVKSFYSIQSGMDDDERRKYPLFFEPLAGRSSKLDFS